VQEVSLAEAGRRVDEERVVGLAGKLGDRQGGSVGQLIALADDELLEAVPRVEAAQGARGDVGVRRLAGWGLFATGEVDSALRSQGLLGTALEDGSEPSRDPGSGGRGGLK
jgi:hypothetical protein